MITDLEQFIRKACDKHEEAIKCVEKTPFGRIDSLTKMREQTSCRVAPMNRLPNWKDEVSD